MIIITFMISVIFAFSAWVKENIFFLFWHLEKKIVDSNKG